MFNLADDPAELNDLARSPVRKVRLDQRDRHTLAKAVSEIVQLVTQYRDRLVELDVNPIILDAAGNCTAVDALVRMRS